MLKKTDGRVYAILALAVAVFATSSGILMASNMGFKINRSLRNGFVSPGPKNENRISYPYNNPYTTAKLLCNSVGAVGAGATGSTVAQLDPATGATVSFACPLAGPGFTPVPQRGVRARLGASGPTSAVLVGSSVESGAGSFYPTLIGGFVSTTAPKGDNELSVVYHTTRTNAEGICDDIAACNAGSKAGLSVIRLDSATGSSTSHPCATAINNFSLVIGESVIVRKTTAGNLGPGTCAPAHF